MSSSENMFAEVIGVAKFIDEFRGHYFALPGYQEKIELLKDQIEHALEKLDAIPIERIAYEAAMYLYLRGKLLDVSPAYKQEIERLLTDAVKLNSSVVDAWICLGTYVWKRGDLDKAKSCFNSGLEQDPNDKQLLLQLSVLERRQCIGETEVENPVEIINDCIKHVKEAIALDIQDGISWYILGNACLTAYFVTGCWDINMLLQSLKAYKNALKDERMKLSSHMCYNCAMTYKYFEDYETAPSGFEAAELLDPDLNGLEQAFNLYEILERINSFLQMARTCATGRGGRPPLPPARGRVRGRGRAAWAVPVYPPVAPIQDQPPVVETPAAPAQAPVVPIVIPGLQEALAQVLSVCTGLAQAVSSSTAAATSQTGGGHQTPAARLHQI